MNKSSKSIIFVLIAMILVSASGCIASSGEASSEYEITWAQKPPMGSKTIEEKISQVVSPFAGIQYENITISTYEKNEIIRLHVIARTPDSRFCDLYDFTYKDGELVQTGYLLEAIPESVRFEAIGYAAQNEKIANGLKNGAYNDVSVKRILPGTSERFYASKTLISVTWVDSSLSALVDMDTGEVVQVWRG